MPRVFLSLGSNINPEGNLRLGIRELKARYAPLDISPVYLNKAVGFDGDDFLNLVVGCNAQAYIESIVEEIAKIHTLAGRSGSERKFSSRTLDIDLLTYGQVVTTVPPVKLPRRDVLDYSFVLKPLVDIAPELRHPVTGRTYAEHWAEKRQEGDDLRVVKLAF